MKIGTVIKVSVTVDEAVGALAQHVIARDGLGGVWRPAAIFTVDARKQRLATIELELELVAEETPATAPSMEDRAT